MANIIYTCHVGFHVDFSSTKDVMSCSSKLASCKPKVGARETLNQWKFKDSQKPWPNDFRANKPLVLANIRIVHQVETLWLLIYVLSQENPWKCMSPFEVP